MLHCCTVIHDCIWAVLPAKYQLDALTPRMHLTHLHLACAAPLPAHHADALREAVQRVAWLQQGTVLEAAVPAAEAPTAPAPNSRPGPQAPAQPLDLFSAGSSVMGAHCRGEAACGCARAFPCFAADIAGMRVIHAAE